MGSDLQAAAEAAGLEVIQPTDLVLSDTYVKLLGIGQEPADPFDPFHRVV